MVANWRRKHQNGVDVVKVRPLLQLKVHWKKRYIFYCFVLSYHTGRTNAWKYFISNAIEGGGWFLMVMFIFWLPGACNGCCNVLRHLGPKNPLKFYKKKSIFPDFVYFPAFLSSHGFRGSQDYHNPTIIRHDLVSLVLSNISVVKH